MTPKEYIYLVLLNLTQLRRQLVDEGGIRAAGSRRSHGRKARALTALLGALLLGGLGVLSWFDMIGGPVTPSPPQDADQAVVSVDPEAEPSDAGTEGAPDAQKPFGELALSLGWVLSGLLPLSGATAYEAVRRGNQARSEQA